MEKLSLTDVTRYVEENIGTFHEKRLQSLDGLKLHKVLNRKNPYLFKAKNVLTSEQIIKGLLDAQISSSEETIFGDWLEGLAIFINEKVYAGRKSGIEGIDLEFDLDGTRYIINIKSGPHWGNSTQIRKMVEDFKRAKKILRTSGANFPIEAVNGCCYGKDNNPEKGDYRKLCGQRFWEFISGNEKLYLDIIEPLGYRAKERNDAFMQSYAKVVNKFTKDFSNEFCRKDGSIDWEKIVEVNSGR
ncbi:PmeII family type II restriction endonuclease [Leptolyngbya sp. 7M]|uniref:PmeII family type II restriction endonuclease n=1 Tax=Leptolyngbya sp. 7M TaxID=2812896 RepID=UPI001B8CB641|nr:PmeII family type II restriction endonuclease [Leptolyngbya sp. 7M]QYO63025.1 cytosolic protein [Leptolyngbya sp. 7M]